jgi:Fe-S oxidoreductase
MLWHPAHAWVVAAALALCLAFFVRQVLSRLSLLRSLAPVPDPVADHPRRLRELLTVFLGQSRLFQDPVPGIMHALIFWGFCVLLLRALTLFGMAFAGFDFHLPGFSPESLFGRSYGLLKDAANVTVSLMVLLALWRRYVARVPRLLNTADALFVLLMILGLMLSDLTFEAALRGAAPAALGHGAFLFHCLGILAFLIYLPMGKHMHVLSSVFNVYLRPLGREGRLTKPDLADEKVDVFGTPTAAGLTWKEGLDLLTCTECGRCNEACPAATAGKELAPREVARGERDTLLRGLAEEFVPGAASPEAVWACTTCGACEQACPVGISHVQRINSLRRSEVLMAGRFPAELKKAFKGMENNSNPWGLGASGRLDWAKDLALPLWRQTPGAEYLLYLGCAASFDDRARRSSRHLAGLLKGCGISFAVLGEEEACCGETARRLGEEALGQTLAEHNAGLFRELGVKKILTPCPHCYNTFKNEYPDFGFHAEVVHHTELLRDLLRQGKLRRAGAVRVAIHDSCYLGRVNGVYEPSRELVGGASLEPERTRETGFCCGAGGGGFWLDEKGPRINHERVRQLAALGPEVIATSCPYCLNMMETGVKDLGAGGAAVKDLAELLEIP